MLSSIHIRLARAALEMSQLELAKLTGLSTKTIQNLESGSNGTDRANIKTIRSIKSVFEEKGIKFLTSKEDGTIDGIGIRYFPNNIHS